MWAAFLFVSDGLIGWDDIDTRSVLSAALERILTTEMFINMNLEKKKMSAIKKYSCTWEIFQFWLLHRSLWHHKVPGIEKPDKMSECSLTHTHRDDCTYTELIITNFDQVNMKEREIYDRKQEQNEENRSTFNQILLPGYLVN